MEEVTALPADPDKVESPAEPKVSKNFTAEERATIITKANEVGFEKVANEFGIRARLISYWIQQEKKKESKLFRGTKTRAKGSKLDAVEHIAKEAQTEPIIADKPVTPTGRKAEEKWTDGLIIENAILKERIALLNKEIEKLQAALMSLM